MIAEAGILDRWVSLWTVQSLWWAFGIFFLAALTEMWFPPFPGDAVFFLGIVSLHAADRPVIGSIVAGTLGGLSGFALLYWFGRTKGRRVFAKRQSGVFSPAGLEQVGRWFHRWGALVIIFGRFLAGVRSAVPVAAGLGSYPPAPTLVLGAVSIALWNGILATAALVLHQNWEKVTVWWRTYNLVAWGLLVLVILVLALRYVQRRRANRSGA